jgi:hypothetical protein
MVRVHPETNCNPRHFTRDNDSGRGISMPQRIIRESTIPMRKAGTHHLAARNEMAVTRALYRVEFVDAA